MSEDKNDPHRQQRLYWSHLLQIKGDAIYLRLYRERLGKWVQGLGTLKAIASCGSIAAWAIWKDHAFLWASIIAASQVADALKDVFPFARLHKGALQYSLAINTLFIDAEFEWESIFLGRLTDDEIMSRLRKLKRAQLEEEQRCFPEGFSLNPALKSKAEQEALEYFVSQNALR
jgi:hypothetical protein